MNVIHRLVRADGLACSGQNQIKLEVVDFYKRLMGTTARELLMVDKMVVRRGPTLNRQHQLILTAECTPQEVSEALFSMNHNKDPGLDGLNACFYQKN